MSKSCLVIGDLNIDLILSGIKNFPEIGNNEKFWEIKKLIKKVS